MHGLERCRRGQCRSSVRIAAKRQKCLAVLICAGIAENRLLSILLWKARSSMWRITVRKTKKRHLKKNKKHPVPSFTFGTGFLILLYWRLLHIQDKFHRPL